MTNVLTSTDVQKRAAAEAAVAEVADGMLVGLGTGSTASFAVQALGRRMAQGLSVRAVATSQSTAIAAAAAGIALIDLADVAAVDLCIDGVDEIDPSFRAIKGAGGAMLREKIVASAAQRMVAIADSSKPVARLGARPVPIEVLPLARRFVERQITALDGKPLLRLDGRGSAWRTAQDNIILDCAFGSIAEPVALAAHLADIPGLLGHGLFVSEVDALYVGTADGATRSERVIE